MLQSSMWSQLARLKFDRLLRGKRTIMSVSHIGPLTPFMKAATIEIKHLKQNSNHWVCKGRRSLAVAATLLKQNEIIAIPTDTIYGLAGLVSSNASIEKLYKIKNRDENKPLSISVSSVKEIYHWGVADHLQREMLEIMLPGPYTVILKRRPTLNPTFNPNHDTVGIRVPHFKFINCVSQIVGPLALTSANVSNEPSCLYSSEFEHLWPKLGGIFHDCNKFGKSKKTLRKGSTIVDFTQPGYYTIVRNGVKLQPLIELLRMYGIKPLPE